MTPDRMPVHPNDLRVLKLQPDVPTSLPMALFTARRERCERNHSQSPERLAERGGLGFDEMVWILEDRRWRDFDLSPLEALGRLAAGGYLKA